MVWKVKDDGKKKKKWRQGLFHPINPSKYVGNVANIQYRSGWEFKYMRSLDLDPTVTAWSSEELVIPYVSPVDMREHRYFPDFFVKKRMPNGKTQVYVIEIKPAAQREPPKKIGRNRKRMINEHATYLVNQAKWKAADLWCQRNGFIFEILSEAQLGIRTK